MAIDMTVIVTSGAEAIDVPEDVAADLAEAYQALQGMPKNRALTANFPSEAEAKMFARRGRAWAASQEPELEFTRRKELETTETMVVFRIHKPNPRGPLTDEEKAKRAATRAANKAAAEA